MKRKEELARRAARQNAAHQSIQPIPEAQRLEVCVRLCVCVCLRVCARVCVRVCV